MKNFKTIVEIMYQLGLDFKLAEPLNRHTSIKIGGKTKIFVDVCNEQQFVSLLKILKHFNTKYYILGNGTNVLASDDGFDGVVICTKKLKRYKVSKDGIYAQCGLNLFEFGKILRRTGFGGMEFAYGIPGSLGGAIFMNAGAYGKSVGDFVEYVKVLNGACVEKISAKDMEFCYRHSIAKQKNFVILGAKFKLEKSNSKSVEEMQNKIFAQRLAKQPYSSLSFGSVFKRNANFEPISLIIDKLGLKGYKIGGAEVSKKHAGFIVNVGNATCQDCLLLIKYIQHKIFLARGFVPEPEVELLGD